MEADDDEVSSNRRGRFFAYAPVFLWAGVILLLGSRLGASAQTSRFFQPLIEFFFPNADPQTFQLLHSLIRKSAHFVEYGIFAFLAARAFAASPVRLLSDHWAAAAMAAVLALASTDELLQSLNTSRTASVWDVLLDLSGGAAALILYWVVRRRKHHAM
jgi:VanZ family protein